MIRDEHTWVRDAVNRIMWPEPSPDLHARIMAHISYPVAVPPYALPKFQLSAALLTAFLIAFSFGMTQNHKPIQTADLYTPMVYYGGTDAQLLYQILGT
jgi:hypothetical protein